MTFHPKQAGNSPRLLQQESTFDPRVFWCVNGFLFTFLLGFIIWCARGGAEKVSIYLTREAAGLSDAEYLARVRERRERAAEEKKESPEHRRRTLKACFHRNKVCMVVGSNDYIEESVIEIIENESNHEGKEKELEAVPEDMEPSSETPVENETPLDIESNVGACSEEKDMNQLPVNMEHGTPIDEADGTALIERGNSSTLAVELGRPDAVLPPLSSNSVVAPTEEGLDTFEREQETEHHTFTMNAVDTGAPGYIKLRLASGKKRTVPNCCAVCLCSYEEGETVVWSSNRACKHAFHQECVIEWLIKMQDGTPCPCCRQEFTDVGKSRQKSLEPRASFDVRIIRL
jgi:hypothetical protein